MGGRLFQLILAIKCKCQSREEQIQKELGLSPAEFNALMALEADRETSGCAFAARMGLSPSRGSRVLNRLVTHGYVKTQASPDDRRTVLVSTTAKGRRAQRRISNHMAACESHIRNRLDKKNVRQVMHALELLEAAL